MNYYNPYFASYPYYNVASKTGLFSKLFGSGFSFSKILSGTQKTLNFANQAIPLVKQVSPMMRNAKTMFKVMNEFKKVDTPIKNNKNIDLNNIIQKENSTTYSKNTGPTFFL